MSEEDLFYILLNKGPSPGVTDTSAKAAEKIRPKHGSLAHMVYDIINGCGPSGATTSEIAKIGNHNYRGIQPRTSELKAMKLIYASQKRRPNEFGNQEIVWISYNWKQEVNNDRLEN